MMSTNTGSRIQVRVEVRPTDYGIDPVREAIKELVDYLPLSCLNRLFRVSPIGTGDDAGLEVSVNEK